VADRGKRRQRRGDGFGGWCCASRVETASLSLLIARHEGKPWFREAWRQTRARAWRAMRPTRAWLVAGSAAGRWCGAPELGRAAPATDLSLNTKGARVSTRAGRAGGRTAPRRRRPQRSAPRSRTGDRTAARTLAGASSVSATRTPDGRDSGGSPSATDQRTPQHRKASERRENARTQPRTVPGGRSSRAAIVRCPSRLALDQQRHPSHLSAVAPARHTDRGQQHVRALAPPTVAAARADQLSAVAHPHLQLARETPRSQRSIAVRARDATGRKRSLQSPLADSRHHPTTLLHARLRASHTPTRAGGAARVVTDITPQNTVQQRPRADAEPQ